MNESVDSEPIKSNLTSLVLPVLALASYLTSFLRERYLIQQALGLAALDQSVAAYAVASLAGNVYATALGLIWLDGRRIPRWATSFGTVAVVGLALTTISPTVGTCLILASLIAAFDFARQKSALRGRQPAVLLAATIAPAVSIIWWEVVGVDSLLRIVAGYAAGYVLQAGVSWLVARRTTPRERSDRAPVSVGFPVAFALLAQANALLDRFLLPFLATGWAGAGAFALNLASAAMLIIVAPLASEAVAGKLPAQPSRLFLVAASFVAVVGALAVPHVVPHLVAGGLVRGVNLQRLETLTSVYLLAMPALGYWNYRSRALQASNVQWRSVTTATGAMFVVHGVISVPAAMFDHPVGVVMGMLISSYVGAALLYPRRAGASQEGVSA